LRFVNEEENASPEKDAVLGMELFKGGKA